MHTWYEYRTAWAGHPWLLAYAAVVVAAFALAVYGTVAEHGGPLSILFIPSLAGAYVHHILVQKRLEK